MSDCLYCLKTALFLLAQDYEEGEDSTEENIIEEAPQPLVQLASNDVSASSTEYSSKVRITCDKKRVKIIHS